MAAADPSLPEPPDALNDRLADIAARAVGLTGTNGAALALRRGEEVITVASCGDCAPDVGVQVRPTSFAGRCYNEGKLLICDDTDNDGRVDPAACRAMNIRSMVAAPVMLEGAVQGVLAVFAAEPGAFMNGRVGLVRTLAAIAGELITPVPQKKPPVPAHAEEPAPPVARVTEPERVKAAPKPAAPVAPKVAVTPAKAETAAEPAVNTARTITHILPALDESKPAKPAASLSGTATQAKTPGGAGKRRPEILSMAEDPCPQFKPVDTASGYQVVPAFASLEPSAGGSRRLMVVGAAALIAIIGGGAWVLHARRARATTVDAVETVSVAPATTPAPVQSWTVTPPADSQPVAVVPRTDAPSAKEAVKKEVVKEVAKVSDSGPAKSQSKPKPEAAQVPKAEPMVLRPPAPAPKREEPDVAAPAVQMASGSVPSLPGGAKPYVPNAPISELTPPQLVKQVAPLYPANARSAGIRGSVVLNAQIMKDGTIGKVTVLNGNPALRQAAINAVKQWLYKPAYLNGHPTEATVGVEVNFSGPR